jgi:hypothetical protein
MFREVRAVRSDACGGWQLASPRALRAVPGGDTTCAAYRRRRRAPAVVGCARPPAHLGLGEKLHVAAMDDVIAPADKHLGVCCKGEGRVRAMARQGRIELSHLAGGTAVPRHAVHPAALTAFEVFSFGVKHTCTKAALRGTGREGEAAAQANRLQGRARGRGREGGQLRALTLRRGACEAAASSAAAPPARASAAGGSAAAAWAGAAADIAQPSSGLCLSRRRCRCPFCLFQKRAAGLPFLLSLPPTWLGT